MIKLQFTATENGNCLSDIDGLIVATCPVPEGVSEDYGYLTLKKAILKEWEKLGKDKDVLSFWYDNQEQYLAADASADVEVSIEIDEEV